MTATTTITPPIIPPAIAAIDGILAFGDSCDSNEEVVVPPVVTTPGLDMLVVESVEFWIMSIQISGDTNG